MNYQDVIAKLEEYKHSLSKKLANKDLSKKEYEMLQHEIENYDYIIELTDMNHFARG